MLACRKGDTVSLPGVYTSFVDSILMGACLKTGQTDIYGYLCPSLDRVHQGDLDPSFVVTHRLLLAQSTNQDKRQAVRHAKNPHHH
jgi:threonine dehydrogenase-like Zn-dependent dehydrogenase